MRILVADAEGSTGRLVVGQAAGHGHDIVALGDARDRASLAAAVRGQDAVISTLALDGAPPGVAVPDLSADLVRAMVAEGIERLVVASWAGAGGHRGELTLSRRLSLLCAPPSRGVAVADLVEGDVMLSDLQWTIARVHGLSDHPRTGHYRVVDGPLVPKGACMPREDFAAFLLKTAESGRYSQRIVAVAI